MMFANRIEAGRELAKRLEKYKGQEVVVYGLPRGGVVVGAEAAKELSSPLDLIIARKVGHPYAAEYAIAAVSEDGHVVANEEVVQTVGQGWFKEEVEKQRTEAKRERETYLSGLKLPLAQGKTAILVDDGIATGLTAEAAILEVKHLKPKIVVLAVPVIPPDTAERLKNEVDELVAVDIPEEFLGSVGSYYDDFPQVSDEEVIKILREIDKKYLA